MCTRVTIGWCKQIWPSRFIWVNIRRAPQFHSETKQPLSRIVALGWAQRRHIEQEAKMLAAETVHQLPKVAENSSLLISNPSSTLSLSHLWERYLGNLHQVKGSGPNLQAVQAKEKPRGKNSASDPIHRHEGTSPGQPPQATTKNTQTTGTDAGRPCCYRPN